MSGWSRDSPRTNVIDGIESSDPLHVQTGTVRSVLHLHIHLSSPSPSATSVLGRGGICLHCTGLHSSSPSTTSYKERRTPQNPGPGLSRPTFPNRLSKSSQRIVTRDFPFRPSRASYPTPEKGLVNRTLSVGKAPACEESKGKKKAVAAARRAQSEGLKDICKTATLWSRLRSRLFCVHQVEMPP